MRLHIFEKEKKMECEVHRARMTFFFSGSFFRTGDETIRRRMRLYIRASLRLKNVRTNVLCA